MKITKKLVLLIAFVFALVLTVSSALAAVESVSGETLAELDSNTYQLEGKDYEVTLTFVGSYPKAKFDVNGEITPKLAAGDSHTFSNGATITATNVTYDQQNGSSAEFDLSAPVLDIPELQVGKTGGVLVSYENGEETAGFHPGDEVTLKVKVSNNDDTATVEGITVVPTANVDATLTGFPTDEKPQPPLFLNNEMEGEVEYTYTIPVNMVAGDYLVEFETNGDEYQSPNSYVSTQNVLLKVEQPYDNVYIVDNINYDNELSCTEKQNSQYTQIEVELINNGQETLTEVRVDLVSGGQILDSKVETIETESNNPNNPTVIFSTVSNDFVGDKSFTVKVYREAQYDQLLYDQKTVTLNGKDCTLSLGSSSPENSVSLGTNDMETLSVTVNNPGAVSYSLGWFVYDGVNNVDQNHNSDQFTFGPVAEGQYAVKVVLYDGNNQEVDNNEWTVTVADVPAEFEVSEIYFESVAKDTTVQTSFTVKNLGNEELTNVTSEFLNVDSEYNAQLLTSVSSTLTGGQEETLDLQIDIPADESAGKHSIGTLKFTGTNSNNEEVTKEVQIFVQPESFLTIEDIDFDDIKLDEDFEVTVTVKNDYGEDMDDVEIKVEILDGNDVIDDDEKEVDLDKDGDNGDEVDEEFTFDLSNEDLDEDEYTIRVTVEGKADDNTEHFAEEEETVKVDREKHQVIITDLEVSPNLLQCSANRQISVSVEIENVGEEDEDDVEIRVKNSDLKMDLKRSNLDLDDFSGSDNDYSTTFNFLVTGAVEGGKYPLTVQIYSDGDLQDEEEVEIEILDCFTTGSDSDTVDNLGDFSTDLQNKLAEYVKAREQAKVTGSFRESDTYTLLLGVLVVLSFIAALLTVAVLIVKKK